MESTPIGFWCGEQERGDMMPVLRFQKNSNFTTMCNVHLRDKRLSLKAKGLLSQFLSLPENWDYNLTGLAQINKESKSAIGSALNELEETGYLTREQTHGEAGRFGKNEWTIREVPLVHPPFPDFAATENKPPGNMVTENLPQLNTDIQNTEKRNTELLNTDSFRKRSRKETTAEEMTTYRRLISQNIAFDLLCQEYPLQQEQLQEILEILVETVCTTRETVRVGGNDFPAEVVKGRLLKLNTEHIRFVLWCMGRNTTEIRNIRQYLLTMLYNAPTTIDNYYAAMVNHDMANE